MKSIVKYLLEAKDDNLHQFIQYLKETGKEGTLKSTVTSIEKLYNEATPEKCLKFDAIWNSQYADDYAEENDLDDAYDDEEGFIEYIKEQAKSNILEYGINMSHRDVLIYCERVISVPKFTSNDNFYKTCKEKYDGHLGIYWTYIEGFGDSYGGNNGGGFKGTDIVICGYVRPEDVDWSETICANMVDPDEYELTITEDSPILIKEIKTVKDVKHSEHIIFKGNLIYKA